MRYSSDDLIAAVRRRSFAPEALSGLRQSDYLALLNEKLELEVYGAIMSVRQDFFLTSLEVTYEANNPYVPIPERTIGNTIVNAFLKQGSQRTPLTKIDEERINSIQPNATSPAYQFIFQGDELFFPSTPTSQFTIEWWYYQTPNELVLTESCTKIESFVEGSTNTVFTVDTDLTDSLEVGDKVDIVNGQPPYLLWVKDAEIQAIDDTSITLLTSAVTSSNGTVEPGAGDYICPRLQANYPMIPAVFAQVLVQETVLVAMQALSHTQKYAIAQAELDRMQKYAMKFIAHRMEAQPDVIIDDNSLANLVGNGWPMSNTLR